MADLATRFEAKVDRAGEHHLWTGARLNDGSGVLKVNGRITTARRIAWEFAHGPLPDGAKVVGCPDDPACVRIEHLTAPGCDAPRTRQPSSRAQRGQGSKRELSPGVWKLTVSAGRDEHRAIKRAYRTVRGSEADANRALASLVTEVGHGDRVPSSTDRGRAVTDLVVDFLTHLQQDKGRKHSTLVRYRGLLSVWIQPAIGRLPLEQVRPTDIEQLLGRMRREGQSRSSIHQTRTLLKGAFRWARRNRWVSHDPTVDIEVPPSTKPAREVVPPDIESLLRLLAGAMEEDLVFGAACHVGAATGLRRGELCGLQWARVDLERRSLLVERTVNDAGGKLVIDDFTKTRRARWVGFDEHTAKLLTRLHDQHRYHAQAQGLAPSMDAFVFTHAPDGSAPLRPEYLTRRMRTLRRRLGIEGRDFDATLQALRHWTQTTLSEAGYNAKQVASRGGHSETLMNRVYVHRTRGADQAMTDFIGEVLTGTDSNERRPGRGGQEPR